ncbi:MAG: hypothetical protein U5R31_12300 [Acidimicrobiia bacterium]|nr:hypothetical protein [Acidimicrobiia bacterium]
MPECTTWTPRRASPSITLVTFISLPGIGCEREDDGVVRGELQPPALAWPPCSVSADIGSPCDPVEMTHDLARLVGCRRPRCR